MPCRLLHDPLAAVVDGAMTLGALIMAVDKYYSGCGPTPRALMPAISIK